MLRRCARQAPVGKLIDARKPLPRRRFAGSARVAAAGRARTSRSSTGSVRHYEGIKAFSETDQTEDLRAITVPVLVLQGDDDQVVPYADAALKQAELLSDSTLKIYEGYPHGMLTTHADVINPDILAFIRG